MATVSDAIIVENDWISEHYFTSDARSESFHAKVLQRRAEWDEERQKGTTRTRFTEARASLLDSFVNLGENAENEENAELYGRIRAVLGYADSNAQRHGPVLRVGTPAIEDVWPLAIIEARPLYDADELTRKDADTLLVPYEEDDVVITSVARLLSSLFVAGDHPDFALVLAGSTVLVAERQKWAEGRYLVVDLRLVAERNDGKKGGEIDRALTCLDAQSLAPDADGEIWWSSVLEDSVKHTVGVSKDLREGVRLSIEIIANDVVRRRREQGLEPLPQSEAQTLAKQALRFLYRVLFLLYAEASPELGVLPTGVAEYERGYGLDRLRDLTLTDLTTVRAQQGTHLYESLSTLFRLVDEGHAPSPTDDGRDDGLTFRSLRADLFHAEATHHIDDVGLSNVALQEVLKNLLLSKEGRGKDRGFISYAQLGINQLGSVYEGLMSYTGFFAETDLYEVAKGGDASKGSWVVPVERAEGIDADDFVKAVDEETGEERRVLHRTGTFVFRLAGRERQQSASYYTPEVLTRFTVGQALAELLDQDGEVTPAEDILSMTICEPALGSGAFAIEAVRQLADEYLKRRQREVQAEDADLPEDERRRIDPDAYPLELQRVKAYLALHQVYGVDLNATAVELAEISLWLDTMVAGLEAPWFGLHLRRGNSLIGARRAVYRRDEVGSRKWLKNVPREVALTEMAADLTGGRLRSGAVGSVHHFLLPAEGWGSAVEAKEAKELAPDQLAALKAWRKAIQVKPSKTQVDALVELGYRVETLWQYALQRLRIAEAEIRRSIPVWGREVERDGTVVTREQIEAALSDADGAYRRLRRVMDAWCALWFWPLTEDVPPPTLQDWITACQQLLGRNPDVVGRRKPKQTETLLAGMDWGALESAEDFDRSTSETKRVEAVMREHPWLAVCERIAERQGFFHWELDFAAVFARGGFDLQAGNPPWVRPRSDVNALLAEGDPWWQLAVKPSQVQIKARRPVTLELPGIRELVVDGTVEVACTAAFIGSPQQYPHLAGLQPDLYRCFMEQTWRHSSPRGTIGLIHPESHFTDEKAGVLREATYSRLRRHWQFQNELRLFEIDNHVSFGVHVYGAPGEPQFQMASSLYHPDTVIRSIEHDGSGPEPGLKDPDGNWDLRPHRNRVMTVTADVLTTWHAVLEDAAVPVHRTRMVYTVNQAVASVLGKLAEAPRIGELGLEFSRGWDESIDRRKGYFDVEWGRPDSWDDVILQGPHLFVANPFYKSPNKSMKSNKDWTAVDLEALPANAIPVTAYKPRGDRAKYDQAYTRWGDEGQYSARDFYRIAWRAMAANRNERTLITSLIPPGATHVHTVSSVGAGKLDGRTLALVAGFLSALVVDVYVRTAPRSALTFSVLGRLPFDDGAFASSILLRTMRLEFATESYAPLFEEIGDAGFASDSWTFGRAYRQSDDLALSGGRWSSTVPLRRAVDRRDALLEIDALVALSLGLTADELCTIYRTQFPVLYGYDRNRDHYDANGRLVPQEVLKAWRQKGDRISEDERTATHPGSGIDYTYELPFRTLDREADMRQAYAEFERRLKDRT